MHLKQNHCNLGQTSNLQVVDGDLQLISRGSHLKKMVALEDGLCGIMP